VDGRLILELKVVARVLEMHRQQLKTYMRLAGVPVGLLINFNVPIPRHGIRRVLATDP
jgi:GxxExxY protein